MKHPFSNSVDPGWETDFAHMTPKMAIGAEVTGARDSGVTGAPESGVTGAQDSGVTGAQDTL